MRSASIACLVAAAAAGAASSSSSSSSPQSLLRDRAIPPQINNAPIIGVLTMPLADSETPCSTISSPSHAAVSTSTSCFGAFYARWLESAGARVVVIPYDANATLMSSLLSSVNGVLFTGGGLENLSWTNPYMMAAQTVLDYVVQANDKGVFFPLHGTCQGMQVLSLLTSHNQSVLVEYAFDSENYSVPLDFTPDGVSSSRLFGGAPASILKTFSTENVTLNLHHDGVPPDRFLASSALTSFYTLVSTNLDRVGKAFVSTLEAKQYPITAVQWHPERNQFEWREGMGINHGPDAVAAMQYVANFFVSDARRNNQSFSDVNLLAAYSVFSYPIVNAPDAATSGYQWFVVQA
jgi:gamma-glutamyl hydrolase